MQTFIFVVRLQRADKRLRWKETFNHEISTTKEAKRRALQSVYWSSRKLIVEILTWMQLKEQLKVA